MAKRSTSANQRQYSNGQVSFKKNTSNAWNRILSQLSHLCTLVYNPKIAIVRVNLVSCCFLLNHQQKATTISSVTIFYKTFDDLQRATPGRQTLMPLSPAPVHPPEDLVDLEEGPEGPAEPV